MGRVLRGALVVVVVLVLVGVVAVGGLLAVLTVPGQPPLSGTLQVKGLAERVEISRDASGITHILASTNHDLLFAQGWVHASERMWQMEVYRRAGQGRLAELLGEPALARDRYLRTLGLRAAAERDLAAISQSSRDLLQAYSDGVNAYLDGHPGSLGTAFSIVGANTGGSLVDGVRPEPWSPLDTLTFAKLQALVLGGNVDTEIFRMLADARLGDPALTDQLFPAYRDDQPEISAPESTATSSSTATAASTPASTAAGTSSTTVADAGAWLDLARVTGSVGASIGLTPETGLAGTGGVGSNDWVVGPQHTRTGKPMLANDPHLAFSMPSIWYVNHLQCRTISAACEFDVAGVTFPGTPGVILGHNQRIAWGVTNVNPDVQDLVEERVDPADPGRYLTGDGSVPFTVRTETINVAGGDPVTMTVRETIHGPVITDVTPSLRDGGTPYALRWTALAQPDRILEAFLDVDRATDWTSFRAGLAKYGAPSQNFVYADVDGHIGYQLPGAIPVRTLATDLGDRPVPGWDGQHEWASFVPFDQLPSVFDPPSGRIVTANNKVFSAGPFLGQEWDRGDRAARILELLDAAGDDVTLDTFAAIQGDTRLHRAPRLIEALASAVPAPATADGKAVLDLIAGWDGACDVDSRGCAAYVVFEHALVRGLFDDELGPLARDYSVADPAPELAATLLGTPEGRASAWWGDARTGRTADAAQVAAFALDAAGSWLRRDLGAPADWRWGRIHTIRFAEETLGESRIAPLEWLFNSPTYPVAGAAGAVDNTYYGLWRAYPDPADPSFEPASTLGELFAVSNGPSMRALYDLSDFDAGRIVTTTGQSGQPFSRYAANFVEPWLANRTMPLPFSRDAVERASAALLVLEPGR